MLLQPSHNETEIIVIEDDNADEAIRTEDTKPPVQPQSRRRRHSAVSVPNTGEGPSSLSPSRKKPKIEVKVKLKPEDDAPIPSHMEVSCRTHLNKNPMLTQRTGTPGRSYDALSESTGSSVGRC